MSDRRTIHIQGIVYGAPTAQANGYAFNVIPNGRNYAVKVVLHGDSGIPDRYKKGDKVIVSGSASTGKNENGTYVIIRAESIIIEL